MEYRSGKGKEKVPQKLFLFTPTTSLGCRLLGEPHPRSSWNPEEQREDSDQLCQSLKRGRQQRPAACDTAADAWEEDKLGVPALSVSSSTSRALELRVLKRNVRR